MRMSAVLILLCASALPVSLAAQTPDRPLIRTNWSLKTPKKAQTTQTAPSNVQGPPVPAPQRLKLPRSPSAQKAAGTPRSRAKRVNAAPIAASILRRKKDD